MKSAIWLKLVAISVFTLVACMVTADASSNQSDSRSPSTSATKADDDQQAKQEKKEDSIDTAYRGLKQSVQRLKAIWKQQPENKNAIRRELQELRAKSATLRIVKVDRSSEGAQPRPRSGVAPPPAGPVKPSSRRPTPAEIERLIEEIDRTHLPTKSLRNHETAKNQSPDKMPSEDLDRHFAALEQQLGALDDLFKQPAISREAIQINIARVEKIVQHLVAEPDSSGDKAEKE